MKGPCHQAKWVVMKMTLNFYKYNARPSAPRGCFSEEIRYKKSFFFGYTTSLILFEQWGGSFYVPHEQISESASSFEKLEE